MNRRLFLNQVGISSLTAASAAVGISTVAEAGSTLVKNGPANPVNVPDQGPLRLPAHLDKIVRNSALLKKPDNLTVACYTFPNYHPSAIHNELYGPGWTEYNLLRPARPWFEGHQQPRGPLLGELDESQPGTWKKYNEIARQHGIDVLIWDWYWYDGGPALHEALENGFLEAPNKDDVKFACMWTNHPWYILFPTMQTDGVPKYPPSYPPPDKGLDTCWQSMSYIVSRYFHLPNYWTIDGKPVLCIWDPNHLEKSMGIAGTKKLIADLRDYAKSLGHKGIHIHASGFYSPNCKEEGYDTSGSYNPLDWSASRFQPKENEICDYEIAAADVVTKIWPEEHTKKIIPYIPAVAPGWDSTPRYIPRHPRPPKPDRDIWPGCTIFKNESPAAFKSFVQASFAYLNQHKEVPPILTVACFNEWTEGHYLLPDNRFGYGMLDALAEALGIEHPILLPGK